VKLTIGSIKSKSTNVQVLPKCILWPYNSDPKVITLVLNECFLLSTTNLTYVAEILGVLPYIQMVYGRWSSTLTFHNMCQNIQVFSKLVILWSRRLAAQNGWEKRKAWLRYCISYITSRESTASNLIDQPIYCSAIYVWT
jgi:hypothetical protein